VRLSACTCAWWYQQHLSSTTKCATVAKGMFTFSEISSRTLNYAPILQRALRIIPPRTQAQPRRTASHSTDTFTIKLYFISTPPPPFCTDSSFSADSRLHELDDRDLIPGKIRSCPLCHHFQIGSRAYHSTIGKRVQRVRGEKITIPQENRVELRCSRLFGTERSVMNIGIHFQCETPARFQELTKYQQ